MNLLKRIPVILVLATGYVFGQPNTPNSPDAPCGVEPGSNVSDTVVSTPDEEGYLSLFDGSSFTGWWQSCQTGHSSGNTREGAVFRVSEGEQAIYSSQRAGGVGGLLMTKKKFENYELVFQTWPDYGNDAGIFHRTPANGSCFQTVMDYIGGASVGGTWGEAGYPGNIRDIRPWKYQSETSIDISGEFSWTNVTKNLNPTSYGCPSSGCVSSDYVRLWDPDGWMDFKIQFYGGLDDQSTVKMKSWFKKPESEVWVPILQDTTLRHRTPPGYIGLQVHKGGSWRGARGTWYKNIRWKPLDDNGEPIPLGIVGCTDPAYEEYNENATISDPDSCITVPIVKQNDLPKGIQFTAENAVNIDVQGIHDIYLLNAQGKVLNKEKIRNKGVYTTSRFKLPQGLYFIQIQTPNDKYSQQFFVK